MSEQIWCIMFYVTLVLLGKVCANPRNLTFGSPGCFYLWKNGGVWGSFRSFPPPLVDHLQYPKNKQNNNKQVNKQQNNNKQVNKQVNEQVNKQANKQVNKQVNKDIFLLFLSTTSNQKLKKKANYTLLPFLS